MCSPSFYAHWSGCGDLKSVVYLDDGVFSVHGEKKTNEASHRVQDTLPSKGRLLANEENQSG